MFWVVSWVGCFVVYLCLDGFAWGVYFAWVGVVLLVLVAGLEGFVFDFGLGGFCVVLVVGCLVICFCCLFGFADCFTFLWLLVMLGFCWRVGGFGWLRLVGFVFRCLSFLLVCMGLGLWVWGCLFGG